MAVSEQTPYIEHTGNGVTTSFALKFQCESKDHLIVLVDEIEPPIASWSLVGGNVVFTTAPAAGKKITLQRNTPFSRNVDYQSYNNSFRPPAVNKDFDWIWWKLQELGVADWILSARIDALKNYVDRKDDELKAYLMEEIRKQGVALDQLDEYYNYLMERLAQIAVDKGWSADFVVDPSGKNQAEINKFQQTNLKMFGNNVGGGGDDSQAFINAAAVDRNYYIPSGTYQVDSNKVNINLHNFIAADKVVIYVDGVAKDYSGAFNGPFRSNTNGGSYFWFNGKTGKTLARWSDGASASDSHQFYLPLEVRADGHGFMLRQATRGAGIDILYQDELSDDLFYLKVDGTTEDCIFGIAFDTTPKTNGTGGGAGGFDNAIEVRNVAGVARVRFPAAQAEFNQPLNMRRRGSSATRNYQFSVNSANGLDLNAQNASTGADIALLANFQDTQLTLGRETIFLPGYTHTASHRNAFNLVDGGSVARNMKKTFPITVGSADRAVGEFTIIYVGSGGGIFTRSAKFKANGSTVNFEESSLNDVLPDGLVANVVYDGSTLNLVLHNNDYAATMRYTLRLEWLQAYY